jgi:EAL domain-containing protein (putative c-di-GMP-specific phosphodiesterase class I)
VSGPRTGTSRPPKPTGGVDAARAAAASGAAVFEWRARADELGWAGAAEALGLAKARTWGELCALFVEADRARLEGLRADGGVAVARLKRGSEAFRRVRIRAGWSKGRPRILGGLVTPAFGAEGETTEHGRLGFEPALRRAAAELDFQAWYQPIVKLETRATAGLEALVRWDCPGRGVLPPDDFLPLLDELGALPRLGAWMRGVAAALLADWRARGAAEGVGYIGVNVTAREIHEAGFAEGVAALIAEHGLARGALRLEITEGEVMREPARAAEVLAAAKTAGASLALDDFGSGHASLAWLERFPVDAIKIDRYFVRTLMTSESSAQIVASVASLAHALGLAVVAEGVEDAEVAARLQAAGCDYGQGFWFSPALSADEVEGLFDGD